MIRRASYHKDKEQIVRLVYQELFPFTRRTLPGVRFSRKDVLFRLRNRDTFVKVGKYGRISGFIMTYAGPGEMIIDLLAVDSHEQNRGIGSALMAVAERLAWRKGLNGVRLYVDASNVKAMRFYSKHGFTPVGYILEMRCYVFRKPLG